MSVLLSFTLKFFMTANTFVVKKTEFPSYSDSHKEIVFSLKGNLEHQEDFLACSLFYPVSCINT